MNMRLNAQPVSLAALLALSLAGAASAAPLTFVVDDPKHRDVVSFTSDAPIELIVGHTSAIKGKVEIDDSYDLTKKPMSAEFDVDLASIDTGIPLRNEHMRDNFLQTSKFPKATFKIASIEATPTVLKDGVPVKVKASGDFSLHGKTVKRTIAVDVTLRKMCKEQGKFENCDLLQIKSTFPIKMEEYGIQRPEVVFQKLADTVILTISATAHRDVAAKADKK